MARDITVTYRCDWCDDVTDEDDGYLDLPFQFGSTVGVIDLCYHCGQGDLSELAKAARPVKAKRGSGKGAHRCEVCGRQFTRVGNLERHQSTAHR